MNKALQRIINLGIHSELTPDEIRNLKLINSFILLGVGIGMGLVVVDAVYQIWFEVLAALSAVFFVFIPSLMLNHFRKYSLARFYFFSLTSLLILGIVIFSLSEGRSTGTENILLAVAVGTIVLFESRKRVIIFIFIFLELVLILSLKQFVFEVPVHSSFGLVIVNYTIVFIAIYFFYDRYHSEFKKSHEIVVNLNKQLSLEKDRVGQAQGILYSMIDHLPLFICMIDKDGRFLSMNKLFASDFGFDVSSMIGKDFRTTLPEVFLDEHGRYFEESLSGKRVDFDELLHLPNQEPVPAYGSIIPVMDGKGNVAAVTFFAANVAEIKEKEQELEVLNQTKNKLFSIISHDLRSPLNLLNGLVFLTKEEKLTPKERLEQTEKIEKHLQALTVMLDNLLVWARGQIDGRPSFLEAFDINKVIQDEVNIYREMLNAKKIDLSINTNAHVHVCSDVNSIRMIVRNIITNAIKFTPLKGEIQVDTWEDGGDVFVKIKDTGVGMPIDLVEKIRSGAFIDSHEGTSGEKGAGIGLYLGLEMLKENGGKFSLQSEEGIGTEFILQVPSTQETSMVNQVVDAC